MAKPPFPWIGGKEKIAPYILQTFPAKLARFAFPKQEPSRYARIFSFCIAISFPGPLSRSRRSNQRKKKGPLFPVREYGPLVYCFACFVLLERSPFCVLL